MPAIASPTDSVASTTEINLALCFIPAIPVCRRLMEEDFKPEASLDYTVNVRPGWTT
jgi:hypothetical protein